MGFSLDTIVPWGRSYQEYVDMFLLTPEDLSSGILGCGDGPASFNAELTARGGHVTSIDPLYTFGPDQIRTRIAETYDQVMGQMHLNQADYLWDHIGSVEELGRIRMAAMDAFLADLELGKDQGRYAIGELPTLPFESESFDLALSSHFLFLYSDQLSADFHIAAIQEMLRVAREVRVFPLLTLDGRESPHLAPVVEALTASGFRTEKRKANYEFQRGGDVMLSVEGRPRAARTALGFVGQSSG